MLVVVVGMLAGGVQTWGAEASQRQQEEQDWSYDFRRWTPELAVAR